MLILLSEIGEETFIIVTHFTLHTSLVLSFLLSMVLINGLFYGFARLGDTIIKSRLSPHMRESIVVFIFFGFGIYNIINYMWLKDKFSITRLFMKKSKSIKRSSVVISNN